MTDRREPSMKKAHLLSYVFGSGIIIACIADYLGYLWGHNSPHPAWLPALFLVVGVALMFPETIERLIEKAGPHLPWGKP